MLAALVLTACGSSHTAPLDACVASLDVCNGVDDDCDGLVDETPEADDSCAPGEVCGAGECALPACAAGQADCDGDPSNGCEVDLANSVASCGTCGHLCREGMPCTHGICGEDRLALAAGDSHTCAVTPTGRVKCWGSNSLHQLGDGTVLARGEPIELEGIDDAIDVAVSDERSCAALGTGSVTCWGGERASSTGERVPWAMDTEVLRPGAGEARVHADAKWAPTSRAGFHRA